MQNISKKDLQSTLQEEQQAKGKITRKSSSRKAADGKEQSINLFYVCDNERKDASQKYLQSLSGVFEMWREIDIDFSEMERITANFTRLALSENEDGNKYKYHITEGRKDFGILDYYPTNLEQFAEVFGAARLVLKEQRVAAQEKEREQRAAEKEQQTISGASTETLATALTIEQLQAALAAAQAAAKKGKK